MALTADRPPGRPPAPPADRCPRRRPTTLRSVPAGGSHTGLRAPPRENLHQPLGLGLGQQPGGNCPPTGRPQPAPPGLLAFPCRLRRRLSAARAVLRRCAGRLLVRVRLGRLVVATVRRARPGLGPYGVLQRWRGRRAEDAAVPVNPDSRRAGGGGGCGWRRRRRRWWWRLSFPVGLALGLTIGLAFALPLAFGWGCCTSAARHSSRSGRHRRLLGQPSPVATTVATAADPAAAAAIAATVSAAASSRGFLEYGQLSLQPRELQGLLLRLQRRGQLAQLQLQAVRPDLFVCSLDCAHAHTDESRERHIATRGGTCRRKRAETHKHLQFDDLHLNLRPSQLQARRRLRAARAALVGAAAGFALKEPLHPRRRPAAAACLPAS